MDDLHKRFIETANAVQSSSRYAQSLLQHGRRPDKRNLVGWGFRGYNTFFGAELGGVREFMKVFFNSPLCDNGQPTCHGYNLVVEQNGIASGLELVIKSDDYVVQGVFHVHPVDAHTPKYLVHTNALLLNYGGYPREVGGSFPIKKNRISEGKWLRDYIAQPFDTPDILLGRPYLRIPGIGLYVPVSYFVLKREREFDDRQSCDRIRAHFKGR